MTTPTKLSDLKYLNFLAMSSGEPVDTIANKYFHELFENNDPVYLNKLFAEDGCSVWEAYQDSGSEEYLYLIKKP